MEEDFDEMPSPKEDYGGGYSGYSDSDSGQKKFRFPAAKELSLSEITGKEEFVAVIGTISKLDRSGMTAKLSDNGFECELQFTEGEQLLGLSEGATVRIIGTPSKNEKLSIEVEMAHELKGFDSNQYGKIKELEKKVYGSE